MKHETERARGRRGSGNEKREIPRELDNGDRFYLYINWKTKPRSKPRDFCIAVLNIFFAMISCVDVWHDSGFLPLLSLALFPSSPYYY